jgi:hypothetical protein
MTEDSASLARDREPARPGTYLQATAGPQRHFSLVKVSILTQSQQTIRLSSGECRFTTPSQPSALCTLPGGSGAPDRRTR